MGAAVGEVLELFAHTARQRGFQGPLAPPAIFQLVRDMPYRRPSRLDAATAIAEWCGTCSTKHVLLHDLFAAGGITTRLMIATYRCRWTASEPPPDELAPILEEGPVPDVHNFLGVASPEGWLPLDATWPLEGRALGFAVNEAWAPGLSHNVACTPPYDAWPVPDGADLTRYKRALVETWCGRHLPRRERFIEALSNVVSRAGLS